MRALAGGEDDLIIVNSCAVTNEAVRQTRQAIRQRQARPARGAGDRHRLRGAGRAGDVRGDARGRAGCSAIARSSIVSQLDPSCGANRRADDGPRLRHHGGARDRAAPRRRLRRARRAPSSRCRMAATIAAPSASSPIGRGNSRSVPAGLVVERIRALVGRGLQRGGADRRRRHQLRPGPARRADARPADRAHPAPRARRCRGCASPRSTASRWTSGCSSSPPASRASCRTSI